MRLFDVYVAVDWSAANRARLGRDSIWIGVSDGGAGRTCNVPTRAEATRRVLELLRGVVRSGRRVVVGFDFPYGYPRGTADALAPGFGAPWRRMWDALAAAIEDDERNRSNRFEVADAWNRRTRTFWGRPRGRGDLPELPPTKARAAELPELRLVERRLRPEGAKSVWQLLGAGCVGSQALVGIPRVRTLRDDAELATVSTVWPFESRLRVPTAQVVHAEIWPRLFADGSAPGAVPDERHVRAVVEGLAAWDAAGSLAARFAPAVGAGEAREAVEREEGWILGAAA